MANKEKRLRKILAKRSLRGKLNSVKTLEEASIIIIDNPQCRDNSIFFNKIGYQIALSRGETYPDNLVHFTVPTNPRNIREIAQSIINKSPGAVALPS